MHLSNGQTCQDIGCRNKFQGASWEEIKMGANCYEGGNTTFASECTRNMTTGISTVEVCGSTTCFCCWPKNENPPNTTTTTLPPPIGKSCEDVKNQCRTRMQGLGECVNVTAVDDWSSLAIKYDQWGDSFSNQYCRPSDGSLQDDCCRCMKKRSCRDGGCYENGGMCVDMKKAHIYLNSHGATGMNHGPFFTTDRGQVNLSNRIEGDGLCQSEDTSKPSCCECYQRIVNGTSGNFFSSDQNQRYETVFLWKTAF